MKYNAKDAISCLPAGVYDATVESAVETTSKKSGADMVVFTFRIYKPNGGESTLKDYAVVPTGLWRMKKLAKAIGQSEAFDKGEFKESDYVGRNLKLDLEVEDKGEFGDQNRIKGWLESGSAKAAPTSVARTAPVKQNAQADDGAYVPITVDDIPF